MVFRTSVESDIDRIMEVLADGRDAIATLGIDQWQSGYPRIDVIQGDIERGESYVLEDEDGVIVATEMISFAGEKDYDRIEDGNWLTNSVSDAPDYAVIHRVAVASGNTGKGIASSLLSNAERIACERGCLSMRVDTHPGNVPMRKMLEKNGFSHCGTIFISHAGEGIPDRVAYEKIVEKVR